MKTVYAVYKETVETGLSRHEMAAVYFGLLSVFVVVLCQMIAHKKVCQLTPANVHYLRRFAMV